MTVKLTDMQLMMMNAAARRDDRCLESSDKLRGVVAMKISAKLVSLGFARECRATPGTPVWRRDETGEPFALKLTSAGLKAIAVDETPTIEANEAPTSTPGSSTDPIERSQHGREVAPRKDSKLALIVGLLRQPDGASLVNLTEATGWLPHTMRAAITGLRKRGYSVVRTRSQAGGSAYRVAEAPAEGSASGSEATDAIKESQHNQRAKRAA